MDEPVIKDRLTPGGRFIQSKHAGLLIVAVNNSPIPDRWGADRQTPATATAYKIPDDPNDAPPESSPTSRDAYAVCERRCGFCRQTARSK